ncbi:MAG: M1 family aminopeptidase [Fidelibacterota bacterium]
MRTRLVVVGFLFSMLVGQVGPPSELCSRAKAAFRETSRTSTLTPEQEKIDVIYYRLYLEIVPSSHTIHGLVQATALVLDSTLSDLELDFTSSLVVSSVTLNGDTVSFTHTANQLQIPLSSSLSVGDTLMATVSYSGTPPSTGFGSFNFDSHNGQTLIWTLSEPYGARDWWPCKDDPSDKADSVDIIINLPDNLIVASNGRLESVVYPDSGLATYHWQESYPIATYLVSLAIYPYQVWYDEYVSANNDTMPIEFYVFPDHYNNLVYNYQKTKDIIAVFAAAFGEYPFLNEKYGHAEFGWGGGMEHQTITSLGGWGTWLIAHELAHQWWGDMVTCASFHHIWLNEGFARYGEAVWIENQQGTLAYHNYMMSVAYYGPGTIYVENPSSTSAIFNGDLSYNKASWVLHMLRHVMGDSLFFEGLKTYGETFKYQSAVTEDFQGVMEAVSGKDLSTFFQQWIYDEGHPKYRVGWEQVGDSLLVSVEQEQTVGPVFTMPIDLQINGTDTTFTVVIENNQAFQLYVVELPAGKQVTALLLDPDDWILKTVSYGEYMAMEENTPIPRTWALLPPYPNPFNPVVTIDFQVPSLQLVTVGVYDLRGRLVEQLVDDRLTPGRYSLQWEGSQFASGVYLVRLQSGAFQQMRKVLLLK